MNCVLTLIVSCSEDNDSSLITNKTFSNPHLTSLRTTGTTSSSSSLHHHLRADDFHVKSETIGSWSQLTDLGEHRLPQCR